ncbi:MAG TPA: NAD(P)/FAD-dependent oxidoreductase, partial [Mycobacteriales bacterium]|nr:NAD(P)/FAD-dependent oxidoreductase [Mycobacteriales bacterium]
MSTEVDVVVVGGGPSGLAAASWLGRYRRSVVVVDSGDYRARHVERSHGYLGRDPQTPLDLISRGREEVLAYPTASVRAGTVDGVVRRDDGLFAVDVGGEQLLAHRVVLATGVRDAFPDVEGFDEHYGASVFHCPACDGYEARDRDVVALGWDARLVGFAATLKNWARSV